MRKNLFFVSSIFIILFAATAYAETLTLSTYYPAPFGAYDRLRLVPRDPPPCDASLEGMMYYDQTERILKICQSNGLWEFLSGVWTQDASDNVFLTDTPNPNLQVGIGTTTPSALLELQGPASGDGLYVRAGEVNGTDFIMHLEDQDGSTQAMHVDASGNVGIGTTAPTERLSVVGNITLTGTVDGFDIGAEAPNWDAAFGWGDHALAGYDTTDDSWSGTGNITMTSGNVGIGTTTPSQRLDVAGQIHASGDICTDMGGGSCLSTGGGGGGGHGDGSNCPAGQAAGGVDASGNVQACISPAGGGHGDGSNCPGGQAAGGVDANGNVQRCTTIPSSAICTWDRTTYSTGAECYIPYPSAFNGYGCSGWGKRYDKYTCGSDGSWSSPQQVIVCGGGFGISSSFNCGR